MALTLDLLLPEFIFLVEIIAGTHLLNDSQQFVILNRQYFDFRFVLFELTAVLRLLTSCRALIEYLDCIFELHYYLILDLQFLLQTKHDLISRLTLSESIVNDQSSLRNRV